jgi:hypothetical protein
MLSADFMSHTYSAFLFWACDPEPRLPERFEPIFVSLNGVLIKSSIRLNEVYQIVSP